jgi:D-alanine-D-alanine ligase
MDKEIMKKMLREARIASAKYLAFHYTEKHTIKFDICVQKLGLPMILKPASCGSSVGVHKIKNEVDFNNAIADGFKYDNKIILEEFLVGQEVECAVMGNYKLKGSTPGEVVTASKYEIYDYEAKYLDPNGATTLIPAKLDSVMLNKVKRNSMKAYKALYCEGLSRVDSFVGANGKIYINEINTLPGFTSISMYPQLWAHDGIEYSKLLSKLVDYAIDRHVLENRISTEFEG